MRLRAWSIVIALACPVLAPQTLEAQSPQTTNTLRLDDPAARPSATLADVELLVGHWQGELLAATAEELWLPAAGGSMVGLFRLTNADGVVFYEIMTLVEDEGSVSLKLKHFHADLTGWEDKDEVVTFRLVRASPDAVWFEGLTFRREPEGSLRGFIAIGRSDGGVREESFVYRPVTSSG